MNEVRLYIEGHSRLYSGFQDFLKEIRDAARTRRLGWHLTMGQGHVVRDFMKALRTHPSSLNVLILDSERAFDDRVFEELCTRSDWSPPSGHVVGRDRVYWMVQVMESWFLADPAALKRFYGAALHEPSLPRNLNVEQVPKHEVLNGLKAATRNTPAGEYHKAAHAPKILAHLTADQVRAAAPNCRRLFDSLLAIVSD